MATKEVVTKVWIEEGCIVCDACETTAPDVFEVLEDTCIVRPAALAVEFNKPRSENIKDAAEECPVDVIKFDTVMEEVADDAPAAEAQAAPAEAEQKEQPAAKVEEKPDAKVDDKPAPAAAPAKVAAAAGGGDYDPAIQSLLKAAKARGGHAGIMRKSESIPEAAQAMARKSPDELPADARQAKIFEAAKNASKKGEFDRREVLSKAALTVGWVAFGTGAGVSIGPAFGRFMMPNALEEPDPRVRVGKLKRYVEMNPGDVNEDYKPQGVWMIRLEGRIAALSIICTHLGCIPNWLPNDRKFKCPCHGSGYKPNGINFEGPTPRPLERFRLFVENGIVTVDKSKKYQYELGQWDQPGSYIEV